MQLLETVWLHLLVGYLVLCIDQGRRWRGNRKGGQNDHVCQFILAQYLDQNPFILR